MHDLISADFRDRVGRCRRLNGRLDRAMGALLSVNLKMKLARRARPRTAKRAADRSQLPFIRL
jgi:hypothetical protein